MRSSEVASPGMAPCTPVPLADPGSLGGSSPFVGSGFPSTVRRASLSNQPSVHNAPGVPDYPTVPAFGATPPNRLAAPPEAPSRARRLQQLARLSSACMSERTAVQAHESVDRLISEELSVAWVADHSSKRVPTVFGMNASPNRAPIAC
jgi:hypothetical protein